MNDHEATQEPALSLPFPVVGIGASAAGSQALIRLLQHVPASPGMAFVVLCLPSSGHRIDAAALRDATGMTVIEAGPRTALEPDRVILVPPCRGVRVADSKVVVDDLPPMADEPAGIDRLLGTLADAHGPRAIGVILSGTGAEGVAGLAAIKRRGGATIVQTAQDPGDGCKAQPAIVFSMADFVLDVTRIPDKLAELRDMGRAAAQADPAGAGFADDVVPAATERALNEVLGVLRLRTGHDFQQYRQPMLLRRLARRMQLRGMPDLPAYHRLLELDGAEAEALLQDLLIGVTGFFRDADAFDALAQRVVPQLFRDRVPDDTVRVWVAACASGEEAYSVAMLLEEQASAVPLSPQFQVFATDIDERAIAGARAASYPIAAVADLAPARLARHFVVEENRCQVRRSLRDRVLFASHNLLRDPAFPRLDLITCRNFLIYLNRDMHRRVLEAFHFGLKPGGYLFLGNTESADIATDLFSTVDAERRIYQARPTASRRHLPERRAPAGRTVPGRTPAGPGARTGRASSFAELHRDKLAQAAAPSLLLNARGDILHLHEGAGRFLRYAGGEPSRDVLALALPALRPQLQIAMFQARRTGTPVRLPPVRVDIDGVDHAVAVLVTPFPAEARENGEDGLMLAQFEDGGPVADGDGTADAAVDPARRDLEDALRQTQDALRQAVEQASHVGTDMTLANEELQSTVEELRATIEALETGREELQARNEELLTVNAELTVRLRETAKANDDLSNLIASTDIATLFLDRELHIKRYTPHLRGIFNILPADVGRPLGHLTNRLEYPQLMTEVAQVFATLHPVEREVRSTDGRHFIVRVHPYRTGDERVDGVVLTFFDISGRRQAEQALRESEERFRLFVTASSDTLYRMNADWTRMLSLQSKHFIADTVEPEAAWQDKYIPEPERQRVGAAVAEAIRTRSTFELEHRVLRPDGSIGWTFSRAIPVLDANGDIVEWFGAAADITERKRGEEALRESETRFRALAEASPALIWQVDAAGDAVYVNPRYLEVAGLPREALLGSGWRAGLHPDDAACYLQEFERALARRMPYQRRIRLKVADGAWHWFESHVHPWYAADHDYRGHVGITIDVNEAVRAEEALRAADRRKDEFLATLAHELRNPLAPISNAVQLLRFPEGRHHIDRLVSMADRQVKQMVRLVDDLMEVTRITRGKIELRRGPAPLADILQAAVETSQPALEAMRHRLTLSLPDDALVLDADRVRLTQVFANLLNNAARYTAPEGEIALSAGRDGQHAVVSVRDTGMGMSAEQIPLVFEMFSQPHCANGASQSGLGIGLAMVRSLVHMHGGTVEARSDGPGKGSEFVVRLPLLPGTGVQAPRDDAPDRAAAPLARRRTLVVDDNRDAADSLCHLLATLGADARAVYDGRAALDALEAERPHAVVLDIGMPGMDGYEVARAIRRDHRFDGVRIIALTGWGQHVDRLRSDASGFDYHLTKPADMALLESLLAHA